MEVKREIKKGYKQTEIGVIPEDWEVKNVGEIVTEFYNGGTPSTTIPKYWNGDIPWVTGADFENKKITNIRRFITKEAVNNSSTNVIPKGNLLVVTRTGVGKIAIAPFNIAISQDITGVILKEGISSLYIFYLLHHNSSLLTSQNQGTSITGITRDVFEKLLISLPPTLAEQTAIATALSDMDDYISSLERLITKKKAIKQGTMQNLLTGKIRLPGFSEEWVEKKLGEIGKCLRGVSYKPEIDLLSYKNSCSFILLRSNNIQAQKLCLSDIQLIRGTIVKQIQILKIEDVLICMANGSKELVGKSCLFNKSQSNYTFGAFMGVFRTMNVDFDSKFIFYNFQTENYRNHIDDLLSGSSINNLKPSDIESITFRLPKSIVEQTAIAAILSDMDTEIEALQAKLSKAKLVKQGAMQELLTGKIRLVKTSLLQQNLFEIKAITADAHVVGGHIVYMLYKSKGWGRTKLQKSMHLIDYCCQLDFGGEYVRNIAGPDNQLLMNHIDSQFKQYDHVRIEVANDNKGRKHYNYIPSSLITDVEQAFGRYPAEKQKAINNLLDKIKTMDLARAEIVSTLYAVWNNRIIKKLKVSDDLLLKDFYDWSEHKSDYSPDLVLRGLNYMRQAGIVPVGWGKYIYKKNV